MKRQSLIGRLLRPTSRPKPAQTEMARSKLHLTKLLGRNAEGDRPDLFAVVSWGCSATKWVATTLNSHPDVFCLHNLRFYQECFTPNQPRLPDDTYLSMVQHLARGYVLAGDVHGIDRGSVPLLKEHFGERFRAAAVVRDPHKRLLSQVSLFERYDADESIWFGLDYLQQLEGFPAVAQYYAEPRKRH